MSMGVLLATAPPASAEGVGPVVATEASLSVTVGEEPTETAVLVAPAVTRLDAAASAGITVSIGGSAGEPCAAGGSVAALGEHTDVATVAVCASADAPTTGTIVLAANDGSTTTIAVTASCPVPETAEPTAPSKASVAIGATSGSHTFHLGFAVPDSSTAIAGGPDDTALVVVAPSPAPEEADDDADPCEATATPAGVKVSVTGANKVGTYSAAFDLNGDAAGGTFEVSVVRRRSGWLALAAALVGILIAALVTAKSTSLSAQAAKVRKQRAMRAAFALRDGLVACFGAASPALKDAWEPHQWPSFQKATTTPDPDVEVALELYRQCTQAGADILDLAVLLSTDGRDGSVLGDSVAGELAKGVVLVGDEVPSDTAGGLQIAAARSTRVRRAWYQLDDDQKRRLSQMTLVAADDAVPRPDTETFGAAEALAAAAPAITPPDPIDTTGADRLEQTLRLQRWGLFIVTSLLAAAVTAGTALDPTTAWGTLPDVLKIVGATAALPAIVEQIRKATTVTPTT